MNAPAPVSRRSVLAAGLAAAVTAGAATLAAPTLAKAAAHAPLGTAGRGYATLIVSPHPDDELIRTGPYSIWASDQGDTVGLITVTDGGATAVKSKLGLTYEETVRWRNREQRAAFDWLTDGRTGPVMNLGFPDGATNVAAIRDAIEAAFGQMTGKPELYVAAWHHDRPDSVPGHSGDEHPDHINVVLAARDIAKAHGIVVRFARHPSATHLSGTRYAISRKQLYRLEGAAAAYKVIGQRSVSALFRPLINGTAISRITH